MIDSCKVHLPMQYASKIDSFALNDTGVVIDSKPYLIDTCKTSHVFAPLAVSFHAGCSAFRFYTPTKSLIRLHFKYKTVLFPILCIISVY